ncbi:MAG: DUF262 domain-containing HNH endonuclease family protein [Streptococcaceae bacterium]|jgi:uncharacterized protein with ParB-like and HNH nuclease domain|nr:DUF262 domain-containing HNH endonuclease family protein [Streptococcaceae bacterium]
MINTSNKQTILEMVSGNKIHVPSYQRAYSWEVGDNKIKQIDQFILDIEEYIESKTENPYYFGHFIFEKTQENKYAIIDGQQRLTTIMIATAAIFHVIESRNENSIEIEKECNQFIGTEYDYNFSTVSYDNQVFIDYIFEENKSKINPKSSSQKRIVTAYDKFKAYFWDKDAEYLQKVFSAISEASCSTFQVESETQAIQMFIFENNRGKSPSRLEILKAKMMFQIHLSKENDSVKSGVIEQIKSRFERIYESISFLEDYLDEDSILSYAVQVFLNNLKVEEPDKKIEAKLVEDPIKFSKNFTEYLENSFENLTQFYRNDRKKIWPFEELISLGGIALAMPFIIKSYRFNISDDNKGKLAKALRDILLRKRLTNRKTDLAIRLNDKFKEFDDLSEVGKNVDAIISHIEWMKHIDNESWWWASWNDDKVKEKLEQTMNRGVSKYLLWLYENHLSSEKILGYKPRAFDDVISPDLEHIAPQTPTNGEPIANGYPKYDDEFKEKYLDSIGNHLLLSASHNRAIGNRPFEEKRKTYNGSPLKHQQEVYDMTQDSKKWTKELIDIRKNKIIDYLMATI